MNAFLIGIAVYVTVGLYSARWWVHKEAAKRASVDEELWPLIFVAWPVAFAGMAIQRVVYFKNGGKR